MLASGSCLSQAAQSDVISWICTVAVTIAVGMLPLLCAVILIRIPSRFRRSHSTYKKVVQGKCPLHFLHFNGAVCSNTLFSNTSALTSSPLFRANSTCKGSRTPRWSNTSGLQFCEPLARTNFLSALCGLPKDVPIFSNLFCPFFCGCMKRQQVDIDLRPR